MLNPSQFLTSVPVFESSWPTLVSLKPENTSCNHRKAGLSGFGLIILFVLLSFAHVTYPTLHHLEEGAHHIDHLMFVFYFSLVGDQYDVAFLFVMMIHLYKTINNLLNYYKQVLQLHQFLLRFSQDMSKATQKLHTLFTLGYLP